MLQYLVIILDDSSVSYCHYNSYKESRLMGIEDLKSGIKFAMKENLMIQFVYPDYTLPREYDILIESIDHIKIKRSSSVVEGNADITVFNTLEDTIGYLFDASSTYVLRVKKNELFIHRNAISNIIGKVGRLNLIICDIEEFTDEDFEEYKLCLKLWSDEILRLFSNGMTPQLNVITDRIFLQKMNNCAAGDISITLCPDGYFYVCPAFYFHSEDEDYGLGKAKVNVGSLQSGLDIGNKQLYKLSHAPICRNCDAYQCRRCVWLNRKTTMEVNTPGHEQCVASHLERNQSRLLHDELLNHFPRLSNLSIPKLTYLDPYENRRSWLK